MLDKFPKKRIELPKEFQKIYNEHYKNNREGNTSASSIAQKMEAWLHKKVAEDVQGITNKPTLEIGAGTLNQLKFEDTKPYDIVEPFSELYKNSTSINKINQTYANIYQISESNKYDRITSIATFEHITDLPGVIAKTGLLLNDKGTLRVSIPNEGTFLWKLGWKLTTGLEFKLKYGLDYGLLMQYEHVNTAQEIEQLLKHFYTKVNCSFFGISKRVAFYLYYECSMPKREVALEYLKTSSNLTTISNN